MKIIVPPLSVAKLKKLKAGIEASYKGTKFAVRRRIREGCSKKETPTGEKQ